MTKLTFKLINTDRDVSHIKCILDQLGHKKVYLFNLIQKNRALEIAYQIENEIIYNAKDYLDGTCSFNKASFDINDNLTLMPSSVKKIEEKIDLDRIYEDMLAYDDFDYFIIVLDETTSLNDQPYVLLTDNYELMETNGLPNRTISIDLKQKTDLKNIIGVLLSDHNQNDYSKLLDNILNNKFLDLSHKSFLERIKQRWFQK